MRIRVDEIPESGRVLHLHWNQGELSRFLPPDDPFELSLPRPLNVDLEINKLPDHIRIQGMLQGVLQINCHRCLAPCLWTLEEPVDITLFNEAEAPGEEELELEPEELDFEYFDGEVIEIDELIAEQIFLALPFKVLCSESCKGICPGCGANLNEEVCRCSADAKDNPFARLAELKERLPQ